MDIGNQDIPLVRFPSDYEKLKPGERYRIKNRKGKIVETVKPQLDADGQPIWYE